ncbi:MAG: alginate export family protein [Proteobacteria bacterium]|nr:alginate export family protein [Pseudomonadota bacterium]
MKLVALRNAVVPGVHFRRLRLLSALALLMLVASPAVWAQYFSLGKGTYPLESYEIDYSPIAESEKRTSWLDALHYIPLGWGSESYISLGGELREQYWNQVSEADALRSPINDSYGLQRVAFDAFLHFNSHVSVFGELARADSFDKLSPSTTDEMRGRLQQGFIQGEDTIGNLAMSARVGRQEITLGSGRFVWINDSSNVRTTHDGVRLRAKFTDGASLDLVLSRPVTSTYTAFDDWNSHAGSFEAVYASEPFLASQLHVDEYFYHRRLSAIQFGNLTGTDDRDTIGGRIWGAFGSFKFDSDFAYQWGNYHTTTLAKTVSAFGASARVLYTFEGSPLLPGAQLQTSYFSGTRNPKSQAIGAFLAPFPRPTLLNYAGLNTLENLVEVYPACLITPLPRLTLRFGPQVLWRANINDAVYISRTTPLTKTLRDDSRYIGTNLTWTAQWALTPNVSLFGEYLHEIAGRAITDAGGHGTKVGVVMLDVNF